MKSDKQITSNKTQVSANNYLIQKQCDIMNRSRVKKVNPPDLMSIITYIIALLLCRARIFFGLAPFGIAFLTTRRRLNTSAVFCCVSAIIGYLLLFDINLSPKYICCAILYLGFLFANDKKHEDISTTISLLIAAAAYIISSIIWSFLLKMSYIYILTSFFDMTMIIVSGIMFDKIALTARGNKYSIFSANNVEKSVMAATILIILLGFNDIAILGIFSLQSTAALLLCGTFALSGGSGIGALCGIICGTICGIHGNILLNVAAFSICGAVCGIFKRFGTYPAAFSLAAAAALLGIYCGESQVTIFYFADIPLAAGLIAIMPDHLIRNVKRILGLKNHELHNNACRDFIKDRLLTAASSFRNLSETLMSLSAVHTDLQKENIKDIAIIIDGTYDRVCKNCSAVTDCLIKNRNSGYRGFLKIINNLESHKSICDTDIESCLGRRCLHIRSFTREVNYLFEVYRINNIWKSKLSENRELAAQQLANVALILDDISEDIYEERIDKTAENDVLEALSKKGLYANEVKITMGAKKRYFAYINIPKDQDTDFFKRTAESSLRRFLGTKMVMAGTVKGPSNEILMRFTQPEGFRVEAAKAAISACNAVDLNNEDACKCPVASPKSFENGDSCIMRYLNDGKFAAALSDGMGIGSRAARDSSATVNLLSDFLEAGFDKSIAVKLVNSIMVMKSADEAFATVDICVIDLFSGKAEFIKNGAEYSYIKRGSKIETVRSTSLPVGVLKEMHMETFAHNLCIGDEVIMLSDGITNAVSSFDGPDPIKKMIEEADESMPAQEMADRILDKAKEISGCIKPDDMTVAVIKLIPER